jgi:predicted enzyme related to lactoylglutathione lyase
VPVLGTHDTIDGQTKGLSSLSGEPPIALKRYEGSETQDGRQITIDRKQGHAVRRRDSDSTGTGTSWHNCQVERVEGIGGYFIRATDPVALSAWYRDCLGLETDESGLWLQKLGPTVFATFESETDYFGPRAQQTMINFRVRDLDAMLAQLRLKGADVADETQGMDGVGRFGWVTDPEGNRIELWQPS